MRNKAFTLIELLIVVAIIAILAAIAVPNFLEAQTRSKVARVKSDFRSMATAIESYVVDHNREPIGIQESAETTLPYQWNSGTSRENWMGRIFSQITTPVAYMTSVPKEVFRGKEWVDWSGVVKWSNPYYDYQSFGYGSRGGPSDYPKAYQGCMIGTKWMLASFGPDRAAGTFDPSTGYPTAQTQVTHMVLEPWGSYPVGAPLGIYDPTNGTRSAGHLIRTNKGDVSSPGNL